MPDFDQYTLSSEQTKLIIPILISKIQVECRVWTEEHRRRQVNNAGQTKSRCLLLKPCYQETALEDPNIDCSCRSRSYLRKKMRIGKSMLLTPPGWKMLEDNDLLVLITDEMS